MTRPWCSSGVATPTACGTAQTAMGPFYCPGDQKVYIGLAFYQTLRDKLGSLGITGEWQDCGRRNCAEAGKPRTIGDTRVRNETLYRLSECSGGTFRMPPWLAMLLGQCC